MDEEDKAAEEEDGGRLDAPALVPFSKAARTSSMAAPKAVRPPPTLCVASTAATAGGSAAAAMASACAAPFLPLAGAACGGSGCGAPGGTSATPLRSTLTVSRRGSTVRSTLW
jgi:hypothetical protein